MKSRQAAHDIHLAKAIRLSSAMLMFHRALNRGSFMSSSIALQRGRVLVIRRTIMQGCAYWHKPHRNL